MIMTYVEDLYLSRNCLLPECCDMCLWHISQGWRMQLHYTCLPLSSPWKREPEWFTWRPSSTSPRSTDWVSVACYWQSPANVALDIPNPRSSGPDQWEETGRRSGKEDCLLWSHFYTEVFIPTNLTFSAIDTVQ